MKKTLFKICLLLTLLPFQNFAQSDDDNKFNKRFLLKIEEHAALEAQAQASLIKERYHLDNKNYKALYNLLYNSKMELETAFISKSKQAEIEKIIAKNQENLNLYLSALKGNNLIGDKILDANDKSKFASAVRIRQKLKLDESQISNLIHQSNVMAEMKRENSDFDLKAYERKTLPNILTDEQYTKLLINLNKERASAWAKNSWNELKERGIEKGLDSTKVYNEIFNYNLGKLVSYERFANDVTTPSTTTNRLKTEKPQALQLLDFDKARNVNEKSKTVNPAFAW